MNTKHLRNRLQAMRRTLRSISHDVSLMADEIDRLTNEIPRTVKPPRVRNPEWPKPNTKLARLEKMWKEKLPPAEIADALKWQVESVHAHIRRLADRERKRRRAANGTHIPAEPNGSA